MSKVNSHGTNVNIKVHILTDESLEDVSLNKNYSAIQ